MSVNAKADQAHDATVARMLGICVLLETLLVGSNLIAAYVANSLTLYADATKEAVEMLASLGIWLTLHRMHAREGEFDFGLGKIESLLTVALELVLLFTAASIIIEAVERFESPQPLGNIGVAVGVTLVGFVAQLTVLLVLTKTHAKRASSMILSKIRTYRISLCADFGILAVLLLGKVMPGHFLSLYLDPLVSSGIGVAVLIKVYYGISAAVADLSDKTLEETSQFLVLRELVRFFDEYEQLHRIHSRRSGNRVFIHLFLEFRQDLTMAEVYGVMERISGSLESVIGHSNVIVVPTRAKR